MASATPCAASSQSSHVPRHISMQPDAMPYRTMKRFVCMYRRRSDVDEGGGSILTRRFVPLFDGLIMYCCRPRIAVPDVSDATPERTRSSGKRVWSRMYHAPRQ